jgi:hypothetical protein
MMVGDLAGQGEDQQVSLGPEPTAGQVSPPRRVLFPGDQGPDRGTARHAQDVPGRAGQLDVGIFRDLLEAVGHRGAVSDQSGPLPGQVGQLPDRGRPNSRVISRHLE